MWRVPKVKRRQLNGGKIFTMHAVINQGARVFFPISLVLQSTIKLVRIRRPQVLWTKHCHTCRTISPKSDFSTIYRNKYKT